MTAPHAKLDAAIRRLPLVAILRGLTPADAPSIGAALDGAGFSLIEVPLNSPQPLASIATLVAQLPNALIGAGTVLTTAQVREVHGAGGQLIVSPNFNADVVRLAVQLGMVCLPGVMTPTEAFAALAAGASGIKLFPAELVPPAGVKALRAVLSADTLVLPVGGITPEAMAAYRAAGANGFGLGSALYKPGDDAAAVAAAARRYVAAWNT
jgi:2-dehydro-3-deoxyphosphogalactonate aldolase